MTDQSEEERLRKRVKRLERTLNLMRGIAYKFTSADSARLHAGEMDAETARAVTAVANAIYNAGRGYPESVS